MTDLSNKVAIVTGATSGIGRTCCEVLARAGAKIIATGRNEGRGEKTVKAIKDSGGEAIFFKQDVCSEKDWERCIYLTKENFNRLDILVNNAGAFLIKSLEDTTVEEFNSLVSTNVESVFLGMKYCMPVMDEKGGGAIVNVSSLMGVVGLPDASAYCSSKGAICGMTRSAALEAAMNGRNIRINTMVPGVIWTEMLIGSYGEDKSVKEFLTEETPLKRLGNTNDIANAILYLVSEESSFVTGTELIVDGGRGAD